MDFNSLVDRTLSGRPLRWKLTAICLFVSATVVLLSAITFFLLSAREYRRLTTESLATTVNIIADNSGAALVFLDTDAATEVLATLKAERQVNRAILLDDKGEFFTGYNRGAPVSKEQVLDLGSFENGLHFQALRMVQATPIVIDGEVVGRVIVETDMHAFWMQLFVGLICTALIIVLCTAVAYLLAHRLQSAISQPIVDLIDLAKADLDEDDCICTKTMTDELLLLNELLRLLHRQRENLAKAKLAAEESNRSKSQFMANMSHEMRTPLHAVIGYADLIRDDCEEMGIASQHSDSLQHILSSGKHLLSVINRILDLSRMDTGEEAVDLQVTSLTPLIEGVYNQYRKTAKEKDIHFSWAVDSEAPGELLLDAVKLTKVLSHLVENAVKFTSAEGSIAMSVAKEGNTLLFKVEDTGVGISQELQEIIFEPFRQSEEWQTRQFEGTGLGLAICKKLIDQMEGEIWVKSQETKGSIFVFRLPIVLPIAEHASAFNK